MNSCIILITHYRFATGGLTFVIAHNATSSTRSDGSSSDGRHTQLHSCYIIRRRLVEAAYPYTARLLGEQVEAFSCRLPSPYQISTRTLRRLPSNVYVLFATHYPEAPCSSRRKRLMRVLKIPSARSSRYAVASVVRGMPCQVSSNRIKTYQGGIVLSNVRANGL